MVTHNKYLNTFEAGKVLGYSRSTVERLCRKSRISAKKMHRVWFIHKSALEQFLIDNSVETKTRRIAEYGHKLKNKREQFGISQNQLAVILGVSNTAISRWENCNRSPRSKQSEKISQWLQQKG